MRLKFRSLLALAVPILVFLFLAFQAYNWHVNYVAFRADLVLGAVGLGVLTLFVLTKLDPGAPNTLRRDIFVSYRGAKRVSHDGVGSGSIKARRTFAFSGGHIAGLAGQMMQLIGAGAGGQPRLMVSRVRA